MLMAGCADSNEHRTCDSLRTWKLEHLLSTPATAKCPAIPPPYYWCFPQTDPSPSNYHPVTAATTEWQKYQSHDIIRQQGNWVSSRWNPTPEQLQSLEELYRSGTRTPTAKQIQQIAAKLRSYGKIEGKNVFYWFQNHKSRERQKHQRKMNLGLGKQQSARKRSGSSRTDFEITRANNWASLSNSCTSSEESVSLQRAVMAECNKDKGIKLEERQRELKQRSTRKLTAYTRCQKMEMPPATTWTTAPETLFETRGQKFSTEPQDFSKLLIPQQDNVFILELDFLEEERRRRESRTLQLFPFRPQVLDITNVAQGDAESPIPALTTTFPPIQFYEFFPLNSMN